MTASDFAFTPTTVTWAPGENISLNFVNTGKVEHSFTPDGGLPQVEGEGGTTHSVTLRAPREGTVAFHCKYHPSTMRGKIVISATGAASAPSPDGGTGAPTGGYGY